MSKRGERIKKNYSKALRKYSLCNSIFGDADYYLGGLIGKYIKGKINARYNYRRTNSKLYGKNNFKYGDKRAYDSMNYKEYEYFYMR